MLDAEGDLIAQRHHKLSEIRKLGFDPYPTTFDWTHSVTTIVKNFSSRTADDLEKERAQVRTCGRIMSLRFHGKAAFAHLSDGNDRLQIYVRKDSVGEETFKLFGLFDVGDIIGVEGYLFRTKTGELTIYVTGVTILAKSLLPLPEKWHGLTDVEIRYRQRYLDLLVNRPVRQVFLKRSQIIKEVRNFLDERGYIEVETPMMQVIAGGATAKPFKTFHNALGIELYLRIAPELYLKRLVVGGLERVYEINRNFRNEGISTRHNPEFTMLEFYQAYSDYKDLMDLTKELLSGLVANVCGSTEITYQNQKISFDRFHRYSFKEAIATFWNIDAKPVAVEDLDDRERVIALLERAQIVTTKEASTGELLGLLFEKVAEDKLIQPTFVYDFPIELSPLSKRKKNDPRLVERFELYIAGMEIANAYSELNDPEDQRTRFEQQAEARRRGDEQAHVMDEDYIRALSYGMPPTAGEGIGIDRLTMLLTDSRSIRDVILFPHLRPETEG